MEERSRYCKLERFPKVGGIAPLNPQFDKFRYCKFFKDPKNLGIWIWSNELPLKSKNLKDLSFIKEGRISPLKFIELQFSNASSRKYGLWRLIEITTPVLFSQPIPFHWQQLPHIHDESQLLEESLRPFFKSRRASRSVLKQCPSRVSPLQEKSLLIKYRMTKRKPRIEILHLRTTIKTSN